MEWLVNLFTGSGVAHSVFIVALVIAGGDSLRIPYHRHPLPYHRHHCPQGMQTQLFHDCRAHLGRHDRPPALAYSNEVCGNNQASVAYSTVYPLTMFLRVVTAQILVLMAL